jgi:hypothetical protein
LVHPAAIDDPRFPNDDTTKTKRKQMASDSATHMTTKRKKISKLI